MIYFQIARVYTAPHAQSNTMRLLQTTISPKTTIALTITMAHPFEASIWTGRNFLNQAFFKRSIYTPNGNIGAYVSMYTTPFVMSNA